MSAPGKGQKWAIAFFAVGAGVVAWGSFHKEPSLVAVGAGLLGAPGLRESLMSGDDGDSGNDSKHEDD